METKFRTLKRKRWRPMQEVNKTSDELIILNTYPKGRCLSVNICFSFSHRFFPLAMIPLHLHLVNKWPFVEAAKKTQGWNEQLCLHSYRDQGCILLFSE